jgi:alpha-tubulin suppressor-like RCC1 family protein
MTTKILGNQITSYTIDTVQLSNTATAAFAKTLAPKVLYANVANSLYYTVDDTAVNVGGGYIVVTGAEFQSGATVLIDTTPASAVTYVNSTTLQVQVPTKSAASYNLYVVNPDGGVGIKVSGITYSSEPTWVTASPLANQSANTAFNVTLSATGATSYSVAAGSTLPAGTSLAANGYFSGTVTIGAQTTYTFSVVATDAENQDSSKTFQVTVTVTPQYKLWVWGENDSGQLGTNDTVRRSSPVQVGTNINWSKISTRDNAMLAIKSDGTLWSWGRNNLGSLGNLGLNDQINRSSPTQVGTGTDWNDVMKARFTSFALKTNNTLWSWGRNDGGQLGLNDRVYRSSPTQVGTNTNWNLVSSGGYITAGIKTDGTLWTWGRNNHGQLGVVTQGVGTYRSSPVQVTGTTWSKLGSGLVFLHSIKTDGTLWSWGRNNNGQLGVGDFNSRSSPTQVGTGTNWNLVVSAWYATIAIKTDGTLWSWGQNDVGQLGINSTVQGALNSPTQIGSNTNWNQISFGQQGVLATKTDGTLWTWGRNHQGQLGLNQISPEYRSSPVQIGTNTNWSLISMGIYNSGVITTN